MLNKHRVVDKVTYTWKGTDLLSLSMAFRSSSRSRTISKIRNSIGVHGMALLIFRVRSDFAGKGIRPLELMNIKSDHSTRQNLEACHFYQTSEDTLPPPRILTSLSW